MMTRKWLLLRCALFLLALTFAGCRRAGGTGGDLQIDLKVRPDPPVVGDATMVVTLTDAAGAPVEDASLQLKGDMSHPGMQPVLAEASAGPGGVYELPFRWTMGGDWFVTVDVTLPDGATASQRFDFTVDGGGMGR